MVRVPITVMGYRCERCSHEWIPRGGSEEDPRVCPKCRSPWWDRPRKSMMPYEEFRERIARVLNDGKAPMTWTEIRTAGGLHQMFPNNQWVHRLEKDIGLNRHRDAGGIITWKLEQGTPHDLFDSASAKTPDKVGKATSRKQGTLE